MPKHDTTRKHHRKVLCVETGQVFDSVASAADAFNTTTNTIYSVINGHAASYKQHRFVYFEQTPNSPASCRDSKL